MQKKNKKKQRTQECHWVNGNRQETKRKKRNQSKEKLNISFSVKRPFLDTFFFSTCFFFYTDLRGACVCGRGETRIRERGAVGFLFPYVQIDTRARSAPIIIIYTKLKDKTKTKQTNKQILLKILETPRRIAD